MNLLGGIIGRSAPEPTSADEIREQRVRSARANHHWTELDPSALVQRNRHFLVNAETDEVFTPYMGAVWNALGGIEFAETIGLFFTVEGGYVRLFERYPRTWSEIAGAR